MGPPTDPGPWAVPKFPNGQSSPVPTYYSNAYYSDFQLPRGSHRYDIYIFKIKPI
ncbi:unnamed protein product, partial [Staurois parvus]